MWGESSKDCEVNCQCSGLITESFKINSGNNATKRKQEVALTNNYKTKVKPHTLNFTSPQSPLATKRRILGEISNVISPKTSNDHLKLTPKLSPQIERLVSPSTFSPLTSRNIRTPLKAKITRVFEDRSKFKMARNKENEGLDLEEEARDCSFGERFQIDRDIIDWNMTKLDFTDALPKSDVIDVNDFVPQKETELEDIESLVDLETEFEADNFDSCTNYEIISTDSPNIISRGRNSTSRKITSRNFVFGAPLADDEQSTSFNRPNEAATRMLTFDDEDFEFTSPAVKKSVSVKKSLKFNETPNKLRHERSDSSIGSMTSSPGRLRIFNSESTTSVESGFVSELEEPFLEIEESNSPKVANFNDLLSGTIKDNILTDRNFLRRPLNRSLSFNPESSKARVSLFAITESPNKKCQKRSECDGKENVSNKRRKSNVSPSVHRLQRPVLHRAFSENNASIMSALARSETEPDLIGDFSVPFALPLTTGDHSDLKSISGDTLASLLKGEFDDLVSDYKVIDCRYPYEYEGGHILGASNLYTQEQVQALINKPLEPQQPHKRSILVFHCEFSLERGPKLSRYLRSSDRAKNKENYPSLNYPEVYLLHEGYRSFYLQHPDLCSAGYTAMLDPHHKHLLRRHRSVGQQPATNHRRHRLLM